MPDDNSDLLAFIEASKRTDPQFGWNGNNWTAFHFLFALAKGSRAKRVLEVGVEYGFSSMAWAYAMRGGEVVGIEINPQLPRPEVVRLIEETGTQFTIIHENSIEVDTSGLGMFDILFIDGGKVFTLADFDRFEPLVRPGGYVIIDDWPCFWHVVDARSALEQRGIHFVALTFSDEYGDGYGNSRLLWKKPGAMENEIETQYPVYYERRAGNSDEVDGWTLAISKRRLELAKARVEVR